MFESEFESERVFRNFRNSIFCNFWKVWNITNSEFSKNLECKETPVFDPKTPVFASKTGFLTPKQEIISKLIFKLPKPNYSKTLENKKFRKFRLLQGLNLVALN